MTTEKLTCLINETDCGREVGNPVCQKCGMDERVVYPGQADLEVALTAARNRHHHMKNSESEREKIFHRGAEEAVSRAETSQVEAAMRPESPNIKGGPYVARSKFFVGLVALVVLTFILYNFFRTTNDFAAKSPQSVEIDLSDRNVLAQLCKETKNKSGVTVDGKDICLSANEIAGRVSEKHIHQKDNIRPLPPEKKGQEEKVRKANDARELDSFLSSKDAAAWGILEAATRRNLETIHPDLSVDDTVLLKRVKSDLTSVNWNSDVAMPRDGSYKCRSIQITTYGVFVYPYFKCNVAPRLDGSKAFKKTSGSQRKNGILKKLSSGEVIFFGAWSVNDDPVVSYNKNDASSETNQVGKLLLSGEFWYLIFDEPDGQGEIYQLSK